MFPENSGIRVKIHACDEEPLACDQAHLEEVLRNLISNAADAMPEGGEITLSYQMCIRDRLKSP